MSIPMRRLSALLVCRMLLSFVPAVAQVPPLPSPPAVPEGQCPFQPRYENYVDGLVAGFYLFAVDALIVLEPQPASAYRSSGATTLAGGRVIQEEIRAACLRVQQELKPAAVRRRQLRDAARSAYNGAGTSLHPLFPAMQAERTLRAARLERLERLGYTVRDVAGPRGIRVLPSPIDLPDGLGHTLFVHRTELGMPIVQGTLHDEQGNVLSPAERMRIRQARAAVMVRFLRWLQDGAGRLEPSLLASVLEGEAGASGWISPWLSIGLGGEVETLPGNGLTPPLAESPPLRWHTLRDVRHFHHGDLPPRFGPFDLARIREAMRWYGQHAGPGAPPAGREIRRGTLRQLVRTDDDPRLHVERVAGQERLVYDRTDHDGERRLWNYNRLHYMIADYLQTSPQMARQYVRFHLEHPVFRDDLVRRIASLQAELRHPDRRGPDYRVRLLQIPALTPLPTVLHDDTRTPHDRTMALDLEVWGFIPVIEVVLVVEPAEARLYVTNPLVPNWPAEGLYDARGLPRAIAGTDNPMEMLIHRLEFVEPASGAAAPGTPPRGPGVWDLAFMARLLDAASREAASGDPPGTSAGRHNETRF